ncbi:MAG: hypothetical protein M3220_05675 [Chloroflexota bacterium]|nr:hypothetical protein [Chloroflexota bacterium]
MNILMKTEGLLAKRLLADYNRRRLQHAARRAYAAFAQQHERLVESLFDERFLMRGAAPLIPGYLDRSTPDAVALASAWTNQMWYRDEAMRQRLIEQLKPVAADFLRLLEAELAGTSKAKGARHQQSNLAI